MVGTHGMIGEPHVLFYKVTDISWQEFTVLSPRNEQDALYDTDSTLTMLRNLRHVFPQVGHNVVEILAIVFRQLVLVVGHNLLQVFEKFVGHLAEVDHEVQRILYLMGNTRAENTQRCQFLLFLELLLELFNLFHLFHSAMLY